MTGYKAKKKKGLVSGPRAGHSERPEKKKLPPGGCFPVLSHTAGCVNFLSTTWQTTIYEQEIDTTAKKKKKAPDGRVIFRRPLGPETRHLFFLA